MDRQSRSLWMETPLPSFSELSTNATTDVCIVGGGIAGLMTAYTLIKQGKKIILLEKDPVMCGQSIRTTAHLTWAIDTRFYELEGLFGEERAKQTADSHAAAIDYIEKIVHEERLECDFERVDGYLFSHSKESIDKLDKEYTAIGKIGKEVRRLSQAPLSSFSTGPCLQFPRQAQFHIQKFLNGLMAFIRSSGGVICNHTPVDTIKGGSPCEVTTSTGLKVTAKAVVVATCTPINDRVVMQTKQAAYRTYVIGASVAKGSIPKGLYWDTADPYHYVRLQPNEQDPETEWLIVGGEDHKTGQDEHPDLKFRILEAWAKERFPLINISYRWSGQVFEPVDGLGYIGRNPLEKHVYIATGHSGNGMTYGAIASLLIPDLINGKANSWETLYDPARKTLKAAPEFLSELLNTAEQYLDWMTPGEQETVQNLPAGEGIILRKGIKKLAVYKDLSNQVHVNAAFCPHLGGCVRWNSIEKSWDCPCHGSRFSGEGDVITGPANAALFPCPEAIKEPPLVPR
jgi:glycine/D-amino acid oxidase-like deaminating enzyme/nitrite reductase/ring-hydroxylating ferredoxin subunit